MWTLVLASFGAFLTALDIVVVAMALPALRDRLHASLAQLDWTINGYTLAFACLMLTGAAMGDRFGRRRMYVAGILVFTLGSVLAALSTSADALIGARLVQGIGAAVLTPLTLTLIVDAFPAHKRGGAIGIWAGIAGLGVAAGPLIGGAIVQGFAWQAIFWLNVPIGLVLALLSARFLRESHGARARFDLVGVALAAVGLLGLTWAPVRAPEAGWSSVEVLGALLIGVVFIGLFIAWERRTDHPMLPLGFFRIRGFVVGNLVSFLQNLSLIGSLFMISQLLQIGLGHEPLAAGLRILPWNLTPMVVSPIAGMLAGRYGNRPFLVLGMGLQAAGLAWLTLAVGGGGGYGSLVLPLIVSGVGLSMGFPTIASTVTGSVPPSGAGVASGVNRTIAQAGALFGVAIISVVFAANGGYGSAMSFMDGFTPAMWVAALVPVAGMIAALFAPKE
jgi:EmrB/QacA subfamily drug resistance transporter